MEAYIFFVLYLHIPIYSSLPVLQYRLANCASNYGLYDTYVYFFADDIDPTTGEVDAKIRVFDERDIPAKVSIKLS